MPTQRIPLTQPIETRDGTLTSDSLTTNAIFETRDNKRELVKRPGLVAAVKVAAVTPPNTLLSQGLVNFNNSLIAVINNTIYKINPSTYAVSTIGSTTTSTHQSYFINNFLSTYLCFHNRVTFYLLSSGGSLTTPTLPVSDALVPGIVFLDNYIFVATVNNQIYNSDVGDPTSWNALSYIAFEQTSDNLVGICKHLNYLVAFGNFSTQFFYDNANATGSPLAVAQSYTFEIGCATGDSIVSTSNTVMWMGVTLTQGRSVYIMDGVSPVKVSTSSIDKCLQLSNLSKVTAYAYKFNGHTLYVLTLHDIQKTLVYDLDGKIWYQWTQYAIASNDQPNPGTYQESYFRGSFYADVTGIPFVLDDDTAELYYFSITNYQDNSQPIYYRCVTDLEDNGTTKWKFYGRLEIVGDKVDGTMLVSHTGNDYQSYSTPRSVDLSATRSQIYLGGSDRRRAWEFLSTSNVPLRLESAEMDFRIGEMDQEQNVGGGNARYRS